LQLLLLQWRLRRRLLQRLRLLLGRHCTVEVAS